MLQTTRRTTMTSISPVLYNREKFKLADPKLMTSIYWLTNEG